MARATRSLPVPLSPVISTVERVALEPLDLVRDARHRGAGADEPGQQQLDRAIPLVRGRRRGALARDAQVEALPRDGRDRLEPAARAGARGRLETPRPPCAGHRRRRPGSRSPALRRRPPTRRARPRCARPLPARSRPCRPTPPRAGCRWLARTSTTAPTASGSSAATPTNSRASSSGMQRSVHEPAHDRVFGVLRERLGPGGAAAVDGRAHVAYLGGVGLGAERREQRPGDVQAAQRRAQPRRHASPASPAPGGWRRSGSARPAARRRWRSARSRGTPVAGSSRLACTVPRTRRNSPQLAGRRPRIEPRLDGAQAPARFFRPPRRQQRLAGGQVGLDGVGRRNVGGAAQLVGERHGFFVGAAARGDLHLEHLHRPFVPARRLRTVGAVGLAGLPQILAGAVVVAAHQVDLGQGVEHRTRRLVVFDRAPDLQRAVQRVLGLVEVARAARTPGPAWRG